MKATYREMTLEERLQAVALRSCRLPPASFVKRFARTLAEAALSTEPAITERQAAQLAVQVYRFRGQIKDSRLVPTAPPPGYATPAMRRDAAKLASHRAEYEALITAAAQSIAPSIAGAIEDMPRLLFPGITA